MKPLFDSPSRCFSRRLFPVLLLMAFLLVINVASAFQRKALLVGIDQYQNPKNHLSGCVNDCRLLREILISQFHFAEADVVMLLNEKATKKEILGAFANTLVKGTQPGDVALFYYSGHGSQVPDLNGDEPDGFDEAMVPVDLEQHGMLIDDTLERFYSCLQGRSFFGMFDSCHSGSAYRSMVLPGQEFGKSKFLKAPDLSGAANQEDPSPESFGLTTPAGAGAPENLIFLAAAQDNEPAIESRDPEANLPSGIFSVMFRKGLKGKKADLNHDGTLTYREAFTYAVRNVKAHGFSQTPMCTPQNGSSRDRRLDNGVFSPISGGSSSAAPVPSGSTGTPASAHSSPEVQESVVTGFEHPYDRNKLNLTCSGGEAKALAAVIAKWDFINLVSSAESRDLSVTVNKNGSALSAFLTDLSGLTYPVNGQTSSPEDLAKNLQDLLQSRFLQKKLAALKVPESAFQVSVRLADGKAEYRKGDKLRISFGATHDCYVFVLDVQPDGSVNMLFPNPYSKGNQVRAGKEQTIPADVDGYDIEIQPPFGADLIKVIAVRSEEEARKLGLPTKPGEFFSEKQKARQIILSAANQVTSQAGASPSKPDTVGPVAVAELTYQTRE